MSLKRQLLEDSIKQIQEYLAKDQVKMRIVRPKLLVEFSNDGDWFYVDGVFGIAPRPGYAFMWVRNGVIESCFRKAISQVPKRQHPNEVLRLYSIKERKCDECGETSEAERYPLCYDCWWEKDPRNVTR